MDYFKLINGSSIPKDIATRVYRICNGGYFTRLYYAKPPMMYKLRYWPNGYTKKILKELPLLARPRYNEAFEMLIFTDVFAILGMASSLSGRSMSLPLIEKEVTLVFSKIKDLAEEKGISDYPVRTSIAIDASGLIPDLLKKRNFERNMNFMNVLSDAIYDSDEMDKMRQMYPWAKTLTREMALKSISLARRPDKLINLLNFLVVIVAGTILTSELDRLISLHGIREGLDLLLQEGHSAMMNVEDGEDNFTRAVREIKEEINSQINYF